MQCPSCKSTELNTPIAPDYKGRIFCAQCSAHHNISYCVVCQRYRTTRKPWQVTRFGCICNSCSKKVKECISCHKATITPAYLPDGRVCCEQCKAHLVTTCSHCNKEVFRFVSYTFDRKYFCTDCYFELYVTCHRCGTIIKKRDCFIDPDTEVAYCSCCFSLRNIIIHDYNYKPNWKFFGKNTNLYYGVELEIECQNIDKALMQVELSRNDRIVKRDGSLRNGFEIVSGPCDLAYHEHIFDWKGLCKRLKRHNCRSSKTNTCGLHIHFSRIFSTLEEVKIATFIYCNINNLIKICRREPNTYAYIPDTIEEQLSIMALESKEKYELLNFLNDDTIEFRLPKGTLNYKTILATIELIDSIIFYTKSKTLKTLRKENFDQYLKWLHSNKTNRSKYAHLLLFYKDKKIEKENKFIAPIPTQQYGPNIQFEDLDEYVSNLRNRYPGIFAEASND